MSRVEVYLDGRLAGTLPRPQAPPEAHPFPSLSIEWRDTAGGWWRYATLVADGLTLEDLKGISGFVPRWPRVFGIFRGKR